MALCGSSEPAVGGCVSRSGQGNTAADHRLTPAPFEIFGQMWSVQARLGQGASACVYRVSGGRGSSAAVKEFQADPHGGDYAYHKEHSVLEDIQGHKNIGENRCRFCCSVGSDPRSVYRVEGFWTQTFEEIVALKRKRSVK